MSCLVKPDPSKHFDFATAETLLSLTGTRGPLLWELFDLFVMTTPKIIADMEHAFANKNLRAFELQAHSLKSSSGSLGFAEMQRICEAIERNAPMLLDTGDDALIKELKEGYQLAVTEFKNFAKLRAA